MSLHAHGHLLELPRLASADWRRSGPRETRLAGAGMRASAIDGGGGSAGFNGWRPSEMRPGRLVAALAGCGRHETPGT